MSAIIAATWYGCPISAEQLQRMEESDAITVDRRRAAAYVPLLDRDEIAIHQAAGTAVNCARCVHIVGFSAEGQRGFCCWRRKMVSTWHPAACRSFTASA